MFFGPKNWNKIAQFVPGRTHVQCRERWVNSLDPSLRFGEWTQEEDSKLDTAVEKHRDRWSMVCWSKVASCVPPRTDNQCMRRWKDMHPVEWSLLQAARKIQNVALRPNFVDRESERPSLGPNDFVPPAITNAVVESENVNPSGKRKRKSSARPEAASMDNAILGTEREKKKCLKGTKHPGPRKAHLAASEKFSAILEVRELRGDHAANNRKASERCQRESKCVQLLDESTGMIDSDKIASLEKHVDSTQVDSSFCQASTLSKIMDFSEVEAIRDGSRNKKAHALKSKRSKSDRLTLELLEMSNSGEADALRGNDASLRKIKVTKRSLKKCSGTNKSISNHISEDEDGDDETLASFIQNQRNKRA